MDKTSVGFVLSEMGGLHPEDLVSRWDHGEEKEKKGERRRDG